MVARVPTRVFEDYRASPAFRLLAGETVSEGVDLTAELKAVLSDLPVGYVVVHTDLIAPERLALVESLLAQLPDVRLVLVDASTRVYAVGGREL
jgi:hypothetical protein